MPSTSTQRIRDPVHGLIVFEGEGDEAARDQVAWRLLNTPEVQRLRRVRQLGVSEFTFPGATHTRFAHSLGVFHVARQLARVLKRLLPKAEWQEDRAEVAVYAALLHDIGHGPFSHAFEGVQDARGTPKHHEVWTADMILAEGRPIRSVLEKRRKGMAQHVADLLRAEVPEDAYHAIVSSSFDADRLDYLRRDRLMTGSGAGAIDFDWLLDNLDVRSILIGADDDEAAGELRTFCLKRKALQAAEGFLLARYHLFEQVYLHKTTRGMEKVVGKLLRHVSKAAEEGAAERIGLDRSDPLITFFGKGGQTLENYLALDDMAVWSAASRMARGGDQDAAAWASRLLDRRRLACVDVETRLPRRDGERLTDAEARWSVEAGRIDDRTAGDEAVIKDTVKLSAYGEIGGDQAKAHKRLAIVVDKGAPREITAISDLVRALPERRLTRYYFLSDEARRRALGEVS